MPPDEPKLCVGCHSKNSEGGGGRYCSACKMRKWRAQRRIKNPFLRDSVHLPADPKTSDCVRWLNLRFIYLDLLGPNGNLESSLSA